MKPFTMKKLGSTALMLLFAGMLVGCEPKGPAERAGESLDNAGKDLKNAVNPKGPGEKAGEKLDQVTGNK
jgi:hypothetical protein